MVIGVTLLFAPPFVFANTPIFNPLDPTETIVFEEQKVEEDIEENLEAEVVQLVPKKRYSKKQVEKIKESLHVLRAPLYLDDELFEHAATELPLPPNPSGGGAGNVADYLPEMAQMVYLLSGTLLFGVKP